MRKLIDLALAAAFASNPAAPALADSKSAAEFALTTCLAATDDPAKVEAIAREHNWTAQSGPKTGIIADSAWELVQGEDRFLVVIATITLTPPLNFCSVAFLSKNVNRDEFFNVISASAELTFIRDRTTPRSLAQTYEIKSDRRNQLMLTILSTSDGIVMGLDIMQELPRSPPRQPTPAIPG
jgi:hypothetical protein